MSSRRTAEPPCSGHGKKKRQDALFFMQSSWVHANAMCCADVDAERAVLHKVVPALDREADEQLVLYLRHLQCHHYFPPQLCLSFQFVLVFGTLVIQRPLYLHFDVFVIFQSLSKRITSNRHL